MACHRYAQAEQERLGEEERLANINIVEFSHEARRDFGVAIMSDRLDLVLPMLVV